MARALDVYLHENLVGQLIQDDDGQTTFAYAASWLQSSGAVPLSLSLPLRRSRFSQRECRGFFAGVLPEEAKRAAIAAILGISSRNDFAMLEEIGGECAGAVTFLPPGASLRSLERGYRALSQVELERILAELPRRPLMVGERGMRLSLAGAQDKIAVCRRDGGISLPLGSAPSTHIIKPAVERFEGVVFNEAFCISLAAAIGLPTAKIAIDCVGKIDYLLVERYDREVDEAGNVQRLHQEDFCQALGVPPELKYQSEGGPGLKSSFGLLRMAATVPATELVRLLDAVIFNALVGNHDAHAKNFSLLYMLDKGTKLAPLYDVISTVFYPQLTDRMAMKIGGESRSDRVRPRNFEKLAEEAGLGRAMVARRVPELASRVLQTIDEIDVHGTGSADLAALIRARCKTLEQRYAHSPRPIV